MGFWEKIWFIKYRALVISTTDFIITNNISKLKYSTLYTLFILLIKKIVMSTTYHLASAEELTMDIVEAIKATFKSKPITIIIEEDEADFELSDAMKLKLDERLLEEKPSYITSEESIRRLEEKYDI
jgi:hypothetical protein